MSAIERALAHWGKSGAKAEKFAQRENEIWRVRDETGVYALRFHRVGYRTLAELQSEMQWMLMLADGGMLVPRPVPAANGDFVAEIDGQSVSVLTWLPGKPIGAVGKLDNPASALDLSRSIGVEMARLHDLTDKWAKPAGFNRPDWGREGLLGDTPLWDRFWEHPDLSDYDRSLLLEVRARADARLCNGVDLDQGLIHADLLAENVLVDANGVVAFIDFDDCAFGYRDFELATYLIKFIDEPYFPDMRRGVCDGYATRRTVDTDTLDFLLLLRALTYPGWIISRLHEPGGQERSRRSLATALTLARRFLMG